MSLGPMAWKGSHLSGLYMIYGLRMHVYDDWLHIYEKSYMGGTESVTIK